MKPVHTKPLQTSRQPGIVSPEIEALIVEYKRARQRLYEALQVAVEAGRYTAAEALVILDQVGETS